MNRFYPHIILGLMLIHAIGAVLFAYLSEAPDFSWVTILLSAGIVFLMDSDLKRESLVFIFIFLFGFIIEMIGIQTGLLFGNYRYTSAMGPKLFGTPLFIGATWYAVVKGSVQLSSRFSERLWLQSIIASAACTFMDVLIEVVAMRYKLWVWEDERVPYYNYLCWLIFSFIFSMLSLSINKTNNKMGLLVYMIWILFFSLLIVL